MSGAWPTRGVAGRLSTADRRVASKVVGIAARRVGQVISPVRATFLLHCCIVYNSSNTRIFLKIILDGFAVIY